MGKETNKEIINSLFEKNAEIEKEIEYLDLLRDFVNSEFKSPNGYRKKIQGYNASYLIIKKALVAKKLEMDEIIKKLENNI